MKAFRRPWPNAKESGVFEAPRLHPFLMLYLDEAPVVLVVEDDPSLRDGLAYMASDWGYPAVGVENGAEALEYLRTSPLPRLILLDLEMPTLDGWGFRRAQLSNPQWSSIPVVVLSSLDDDIQRGDELQGAERLVKVRIFKALLPVLERYCGAPAV